ncbi:DnaB-like helicase N-terminal domain-containing protein [Mycolicibacterium grossiae]|uniref:DNA helicase DnaB-like N-terminal domain-containing protein n=1 Tax=Mycolicibacterium grossiae TaxID=1552759 RepID=A0A1E8QA05_9MYCO|nr:DnaB-like helicase N-terminal domain-containing protein [Mycolicibacterium grossiae]OFJ55175.1 hypothetical protein BEL07_03090 [Mycolicibacterium grossiae]QEM46091.1 hypothetical protein FZ046_16145 [Mycolicibacterium grossiae]
MTQPPIGTHPDADVLFIGALLWAKARFEARLMVRTIREEDFEKPSVAAVFAAITTLIEDESKPYGPQLVLDELRRSGTFDPNVSRHLQDATTSGVDTGAPLRHYAAAMLANTFRRRVESLGTALIQTAPYASEDELAHVVETGASSVNDCLARLRQMRGEAQ